jgi:hypothetical protein
MKTVDPSYTPPNTIRAPDPPIIALVQVAKIEPATTLPIPAWMIAAVLPTEYQCLLFTINVSL